MKKISLNQDWLFAKGTLNMMELFTGRGDKIQKIDLPHDAMIYQERKKDTANAHQTGFYPGGEYTYMKQWEVPKDWQGQTIHLHFEGIADTSRIYVNGDLVKMHYNPYSSLIVDVTNYVNYGESNEIKVEVCSIEQSSRWYSGAGLYRNVSVWVGGEVHIPPRGTRISTLSADNEFAEIDLEISLYNRSVQKRRTRIECTISDVKGKMVATDWAIVTAFGESTQVYKQKLTIENPMLWSDETPYLYIARIDVKEGDEIIDSYTTSIGIRTLRLNAKQGLLLNGKETKLRGTCIHHDNGVIGAATFKDAEYRRCHLLKEAGFNAIRSSHHPMSEAMLEACDQMGMLVMDELVDMWTRTKSPHDYANYFPEYWEEDVKEMIEKDFNHPCVIMYSTGNEIPELGTPRGASWNRKIDQRIKQLDSTRYTTTGMNGLMAGVDKIGEIIAEASGMSPEELAVAQLSKEKETAGSDDVNSMAAVMVGPLADAIATSTTLEEVIGEFAAVNDIAGYNYLTGLHEEEIKRHPNRLVVGAETFPADIVNLWDIVTRNPHVLGDFTWTGYDYLGEAGCGVFHYDGGENFMAHWPDRLAGIGDIDILGERKPISFLRQAVFKIGHEPAIGVLRMDKADLTSEKTPWMWKDNIASWTWPGYEGKIASVDVYANGDEVELLLNGRSLGRKNISNTFIATFAVPYEPGQLIAKSYVSGALLGSTELLTAQKVTRLHVEADRQKISADGESLAFVKVFLVDLEGNRNAFEKRKVSIKVEGNISLQGFGSANPSCEGSYQDVTWETFDGSVMAVVRSAKNPGTGEVTFMADGCKEETLIFDVY